MCSRVVQRDGSSTLPIHLCTDDIANANSAFRHPSQVRVRCAAFDGVLHEETRSWTRQGTSVPHLPACLGIERRAIEHDLALLAAAQLIHRAAALEQRGHAALRFQPFIAFESRARSDGGAATDVHPELARLL